MKYRLEVETTASLLCVDSDSVKDLFLEGCDHYYDKNFKRFDIIDCITKEIIFTMLP